jgi:glycosyltransferase involved in cell wall biosynthesis
LGVYIGLKAQKLLDRDVVAVISNSDVGYVSPHRSNPHLKLIHFYHGTYRGQATAIRPLITYPGYVYLKWWNSMVTERLSGRGKLVLCNSDQTCEEVAQFFGIDGLNVCLPMDTTIFRVLDSKRCRQAIGVPDAARVALYVGSTSPMKNFTVVRLLMDGLEDTQWILVLRGEVPNDLRRRSNVRVFQNASPHELPPLYNAADFTLCPSLYEPFGYVVAEALACGTPVIASPGGASRMFLKSPPLDRLLIPNPDAVNDFLAAAREILRDPELYRRAVIEHARPRVEESMAVENWWRRFSEVTGL